MKYFIIAGEASGDLHASNLIQSIKKIDTQARFDFLGGDAMKKAVGKKPVIHYKNMAFMGVIDVIKNIKTISKNFKLTKQAIKKFNPDVVVLIDYPGFNLRMAAFAKNKGFRVHYYISPKLWAWKEGRVKKIKKYIDRLFVILPFEVDFFRKHAVKAEYVGNPVVDAIQNHQSVSRNDFLNKYNLSPKPIIALLPGSRMQELKMMLPTMLAISEDFPDYQFVVSGAPSFKKDDYQEFVKEKKLPVIFGDTYNLLQNSHSAVVTSGTATLETALLKVPQIVVYKTHKWQYEIGKRLVKIKYFSLVNLILNKEAVRELLQDDFNRLILKTELNSINTGETRAKIMKDYNSLSKILGTESVSDKTAQLIFDDLNQ